MSEVDPTEIRADEFHPAARSAYRWLKGFMISNDSEYRVIRAGIELAASLGNRQAQICNGTIYRLQRGLPVSDRYLLGLCWTVLQTHNKDVFDQVANQRWDPAYERSEDEFQLPINTGKDGDDR